MEMESTRVCILVRAVGLQHLRVHRARHARAAFANREFQSRGENRRAFSNHRFARAELDLPALALAQLLARHVVESECARSLGGSSSPLSANGRTRPVASSMLIIGGEAALINIAPEGIRGRSTSPVAHRRSAIRLTNRHSPHVVFRRAAMLLDKRGRIQPTARVCAITRADEWRAELARFKVQMRKVTAVLSPPNGKSNRSAVGSDASSSGDGS